MVINSLLLALSLLSTPDAVHLNYQVTVTLAEDGTISERTVTSVIPLNGRGVHRYSSMKVSFRTGMEQVEILSARVGHWRGGRGSSQADTSTGPHSILLATNRLESSLRQTVITMPGVEVGDTIMLDLRRTITELPLSDVYSYTFYPTMDDSVASSSFSIVNESGQQLFSTDPDNTFFFPAASPLPDHPLAAWDEHSISIATGSPSDLSADASIALDLTDHGACPELSEIVETVGANPGSLRLWVAENITYIGADAGVWPGWSPRSPEETLLDGSGVCRDRAVLLTWLLREAGYPESYPALISTAGKTPPVVDARSFDHMITVFREAGDTQWQLLDPTPRGIPENSGISFGLRGCSYLPIVPGGSTLQEVPVTGWNDSLKLHLIGALDLDAGLISGTLTANSNGAPLELVTTLYTQSNPSMLKEMFRRFFGAVTCDSVIFQDNVLLIKGTWSSRSARGVLLLPGLRDISLPGTRLASMLLPVTPDSFKVDAPAVELFNASIHLDLPGTGLQLPTPVAGNGYSCQLTLSASGDSLIIMESADITAANRDLTNTLLLRSGSSQRTVVLE